MKLVSKLLIFSIIALFGCDNGYVTVIKKEKPAAAEDLPLAYCTKTKDDSQYECRLDEKAQEALKGAKGDPGNTGPQGMAGVSGLQGVQGLPGVAGTNGSDGSDGATGASGSAGASCVTLTKIALPTKGDCVNVGDNIWAEEEDGKVDIYNNDLCDHKPDPYRALCNDINFVFNETCWVGNIMFTVEGFKETTELHKLDVNPSCVTQ